MKQEDIKTYSYRITQANKSELTVITYDICLNYIDEALVELDDYNSSKKEILLSNIRQARACIDQLINSLDMQYDISRQLLSIYMYINIDLNKIRCSYIGSNKERQLQSCKELQRLKEIVFKLRNSFYQVSQTDKSEPLMANTQKVYAGLTYSGRNLNETYTNNNSRGFLV